VLNAHQGHSNGEGADIVPAAPCGGDADDLAAEEKLRKQFPNAFKFTGLKHICDNATMLALESMTW
jgi:hypothetical protein